jgi:signal recognition particle subunit SRP54
LGPMDQILKMLPGVNKMKGLDNIQMDDKKFLRIDAVISSMSKEERRDPSVMNASRRRRVAVGSGVTVREVNQVLNQFEQVQQMMKRFSGLGKKMGRKGALGALKSMGDLSSLTPGTGAPALGSDNNLKRHHKKKKRH